MIRCRSLVRPVAQVFSCVLVLLGCGGSELRPSTSRAPEMPPSPRFPTVSEPLGSVGEEPPAELARMHVRCADRNCREGIGMLVGPAGSKGPDGQPNRCTGALIDRDRLLTAAHCLPPSARGAGRSCDGLWVAFPAHGERRMEWAACDRVVGAQEIRDDEVLRPDWAVVTLHRPVERAFLPVDESHPAAFEIVEVVAVDPHPIYRTQHAIGTRLCRVRGADEASLLFGPDAARVGWLSDCPTITGNSGAPVLDRHGRIRGILHGGSDPLQAIGVTTPVSAAAALRPLTGARARTRGR